MWYRGITLGESKYIFNLFSHIILEFSEASTYSVFNTKWWYVGNGNADYEYALSCTKKKKKFEFFEKVFEFCLPLYVFI